MGRKRGLSIRSYIHFSPKIGVDGLLLTGLPGTGKSQMTNRIVRDCIEQRGENFVLAGDRFCEWLNLAPYASEVILLLPKGEEIFMENVPLDMVTTTHSVDLNDDEFNILDFFHDDDRGKIIVVYDAHFRGPNLFKRTELWVKIFKKLLDRVIMLKIAIGLVFHEAGILFPQFPSSDHWRAVRNFAELFVDARKGWVRFIGVSQLEREVMNTIRNKCLWRVFRKGTVSKDNPQPIWRKVPFLALDQYILSFGGLYSLDNITTPIPEYNNGSRMIPISPVVRDSKVEDKRKHDVFWQRAKIIDKMLEDGFNQTQIGKYLGLSQKSVSNIINTGRSNKNKIEDLQRDSSESEEGENEESLPWRQ